MHRTIYGISVNKDGYKSPVSSKIFWFMIITCKNDDQTTNVNKNANGGILGIRALICGDKSLGCPRQRSDTNHHLHIIAGIRHQETSSSYFEPPTAHDDHAKLSRMWYSYHKIVFELQKCFLL